MDALISAYAPEGLLGFLQDLFALVPAGFLLGALAGFLAFCIFSLFRLIRNVL